MAKDEGKMEDPAIRRKPRRFLLDLATNRIAAFEPLPLRRPSKRFMTVEEVPVPDAELVVDPTVTCGICGAFSACDCGEQARITSEVGHEPAPQLNDEALHAEESERDFPAAKDGWFEDFHRVLKGVEMAYKELRLAADNIQHERNEARKEREEENAAVVQAREDLTEALDLLLRLFPAPSHLDHDAVVALLRKHGRHGERY